MVCYAPRAMRCATWHEPHPYADTPRNILRMLSGTVSTWFAVSLETMGFGNLKSDGGLQALNDYLAERSYIEG